MGTTSERKGMALAAAIMAIVVIGALIGGAFFASTEEYRVGRSTVTAERVLGASEAGVNIAWHRLGEQNHILNAMKVGDTIPFVIGTSYGTRLRAVVDTVKVMRVNREIWWATSEARLAGLNVKEDARRRLNMIFRKDIPQFKPMGALTIAGGGRIGGSAVIDGYDHPIPGWGLTCEAPSSPLPGLTTDNQLEVVVQCSNNGCINGSPPVQNDPRAGDTTKTGPYFKYGNSSFEEMGKSADIRLPPATVLTQIMPVVTNGQCDRSFRTNWGDPAKLTACGSYFPTIYAEGDLHISSATSGQGMLLVNGNLTVTGGFTFYGPVIVKGALSTTGTGAHFNGAVMAAQVNLDDVKIGGNATIMYSKCAVDQALLNGTRATPIHERAWADLF